MPARALLDGGRPRTGHCRADHAHRVAVQRRHLPACARGSGRVPRMPCRPCGRLDRNAGACTGRMLGHLRSPSGPQCRAQTGCQAPACRPETRASAGADHARRLAVFLELGPLHLYPSLGNFMPATFTVLSSAPAKLRTVSQFSSMMEATSGGTSLRHARPASRPALPPDRASA